MSGHFTKDYVLRLTAKHMRKSIDLSIGKTFDRIKDFADDPKVSAEIFETLSHLHNMRRLIDNYQAANADQFGSKRNVKDNSVK
jgi:hypothetical protein